MTLWCINHDEPCPQPCPGCQIECPPELSVDEPMLANVEACELLQAEFYATVTPIHQPTNKEIQHGNT